MAHKILLIDEPQTVAELSDSVFARQFRGCDILVASRSGDAFERLNATNPDVVVLNDGLPDVDAPAILARLNADPYGATIPVLVLSDSQKSGTYNGRYPNVTGILIRPVAVDAIIEGLTGILGEKAGHQRMLRNRGGGMVFNGHTGVVSLRQVLHMAQDDRLTGVLRFMLGRVPIELWMDSGHFLFATTKNFQLYCGGSPVILSATNLGLIVEAQITQQTTSCPVFLFLSVRNGFPHDDVVQITRDHGQRLFSHLFSAGRVAFEFEETVQFPEFVQNFPSSSEDADNWILGALRHVKFDQLTPGQRPDPNGSPSYTRRGYDLIQKLKLNDVEARFASSVNGADSLQIIAKKVGVPLNDALLIVFRFQALEIIDFWSSNVLTLPASV